MKRREFIAGIGAAAWPFARLLAAEAWRRLRHRCHLQPQQCAIGKTELVSAGGVV
jgi:hypothetical protein